MIARASPPDELVPPGSPASGFDPIRWTAEEAFERLRAAADRTTSAPTSPDRPAGRGERGPDRVAEMEGGDRFLVARRRARRKDLVKEAANVALASLLVALMSGVLLEGLDVGLDVAAVLGAVIGAACGTIVGREVLVDVFENERVLKEGGRPR